MAHNPIWILKHALKLPTKVKDLESKVIRLEQMLGNEKDKRIEIERLLMRYEGRIHHLEFREAFNRSSCIHPEDYPLELMSWYYKRTGRRLDLNHPKTYNEKIQWFKLNCITPEITRLSDKIKVRDFVTSRIGTKYLIPLLGTYEYPEDIIIDELPQKFVVKANHGSGYNYLVYDKSTLDLADFVSRTNHWMEEDFAFLNGFELQYHDIPRRLLIEEYLENGDGDLDDYKFRCFNGRVELISFVSNRYHGIKMDWFDRDWNPLPITLDGNPHSEKLISRPDNLDVMIEIAEALASGFPHVRVDLYRLNNGCIYFGEMTFTPSSGAAKWDPPELDAQLGSLFTYPGMPE